MKKILFVQCFFTLLLLNSCSNCLVGTGNVATEKRNVLDFKAINLECMGKIFLRQSDTFSVEVKTDKNLMRDIKTEVRNERLTIYSNSCVKRYAQLDFYITMPKLKKIKISGNGEVETIGKFIDDKIELDISGVGIFNLDVQVRDLIIDITGSGTMNIKGLTKQMKIDISGAGNVEAYKLFTTNLEADISGTSECKVNVSERLKADISGDGKIRYKGSPQKIDTDILGSGTVKPKEDN